MKVIRFIFIIQLIPILVLAYLPARAQFTNEFTIGEYVEFFVNDSVKIYFNCTGKVCRQSCAKFYRVGKVDPVRVNVTGTFRDYYMNDSLAFEASMVSGYINGKATLYYPDGTVMSSGYYKENSRTGIWKFYYESGNLKQIVNYVQGFPFISTYYNASGRELVTNGEGKYLGSYSTYRTCEPFEFKGKVTKGVLDGKVQIFNSMFRGNFGYEYYDEGRFIRGVSGNYRYENEPKIELPGYNVHEYLLLDENTIYCPGFMGTSFMLYDTEIYWTFYTLLLDSIQKNIDYKVADQWLAVGIGVGYDDELFDVNVYSSKNDYRLEKDLFNIIIGMNEWESAQIFWQKINTNLFFTILITEGRVIIPAELLRQQNVY